MELSDNAKIPYKSKGSTDLIPIILIFFFVFMIAIFGEKVIIPLFMSIFFYIPILFVIVFVTIDPISNWLNAIIDKIKKQL